MRCLLDKVVARYALQGFFKLADGQAGTNTETFTLDLLERANSQRIELFIVPPTDQVLQQIEQLLHYLALIRLFREYVKIARPMCYFSRWARRLREYAFSRENAAILALATFSTDATEEIIGMSAVATYDQPMMTNWSVQQARIQTRFAAMRRDLPEPYNRAALPDVLRPEQIIGEMEV